MAKFRYTGRNDLGEIQSGVVEAGSRDLAIKILQDNKIYVLSLESLEKRDFWIGCFSHFNASKQKTL